MEDINKIILRDYQEDVYNRTKESFKKGKKGICVVLPCRSGKSFVMAKMAKDSTKKKNNVLILAHRNSLLSQHKELFESLEIENVRIESVFTEVRHLGEKGEVNFIIIDECHISGASSYKKVCEYYNCPIVGFTRLSSKIRWQST